MREFTKAPRTGTPVQPPTTIEPLEPRRLLSASPAAASPDAADPPAPASLGDRVWRDANANGLQDAGEVGAPNVAVTLYDAATGAQLRTTATSSTGQYAFTDLTPGQGVYVQVTPISGYLVSPAGQGPDPTADSDADPATWRTATITLAPGEARADIDVGLIQAARVTGTIFHDANQNGLRDTGESTLLGWSAFADLDGDGRPSAGEPTCALSNPSGLYTLFPLPPGAVSVRVVPPPAADPLWDAPVARIATLAPGQQLQSFDLANTTPVFRGLSRQAAPPTNPTASISADPHVAVDAQKRAVVAWASGSGVFVQRFDASFTALGPPTAVVTATAPQHVRVAVSPAGDFVVIWAVSGGSYARRYAPDGTPAPGGALLIAPPTYTDRPAASVAVLDGGAYVLVREDYYSTHDIFLERFAASGARVGEPVRVNQATTGNSQPAVAVDATGRILVTWTGAAPGGSGTDVFARLFAADATPASDEFRVNTFTPGDQRSPVVAAAGQGRFVVAWGGPIEAQGGLSIYAQRLDGAALVGREIPVDRVNTADQQLSAATSGDFVVAYTGTAAASARAQFYSAAGVPAAEPIRMLAALGTYSIGRPAVAFDPGGDLVGVWREYRSGTPSGPRGLLAGRFVVPPALVALSSPPTAAPGAVRLRFADPTPAPPTAAQVVVQNLTTGHLLDPTEYAWNFNPATATADFKLLGVGTAAVADGNYRLTIPAAAVTDPAGNTMTTDFTFDFPVLTGDANGDRTVNFTDLLALARNYGQSNKTWADGDFTGDGVVNFTDLLVLARAYNQSLPTTAPVATATIPLTAPATTASLLRDDPAPRPVFSTTRVTKPASSPKHRVAQHRKK